MSEGLRQACQELWTLDQSRLVPGKDYTINLQEGKRGRDNRDATGQPLFSYVDEAIWQRPTYRLFQALLDNYHRETGVAEHLNTQQQHEVDAFLNAIIGTQPMLFVQQHLAAMGRADNDLRGFKQQLRQMWFSTYRRVVDNDSSGFEHVFVGETDHGETKGFHNWIQFWIQERNGDVNYHGHLLPRRQGEGLEQTGPDERIINIQFGWGGDVKPVSTMFVGTSPEFDMALYTLCFCAGEQENFIRLGEYEVKIRCYRIHSKYGDKVGSSFPELISKSPSGYQNGHAAPSQGPPGTSPMVPDSGYANAGYPPQNGYPEQAQPPHQQQAQSYAAAAAGPHPQQPYQQQPYMPSQQQQGQLQPQAQTGQPGPPADAAQQGCMGKLVGLLRACFS